MATVPVRPAESKDLPVLRQIEWDAGQRYRECGLDQVADHEPASIEVLCGYAATSRAWVTVGDDDEAIGYLLVDEIDGAAHIEQVSVAPDYQGQGLGRALIERVRAWATTKGMTALTLTTFGHISWNQATLALFAAIVGAALILVSWFILYRRDDLFRMRDAIAARYEAYRQWR